MLQKAGEPGGGAGAPGRTALWGPEGDEGGRGSVMEPPLLAFPGPNAILRTGRGPVSAGTARPCLGGSSPACPVVARRLSPGALREPGKTRGAQELSQGHGLSSLRL